MKPGVKGERSLGYTSCVKAQGGVPEVKDKTFLRIKSHCVEGQG